MLNSKKLRILCLHGMAQNAILFRKKTKSLLRDIEDIAELVYIQAPHLVLDPEYGSIAERETVAGTEISEEMRPYAWWFHTGYKPLTKDGYFQGFKDTMDYIVKVLNEQGPFDGVLGFSQGACLAACLTQMLEQRTDDSLIPADFTHPPFKFVIIVSGFIPLQQKATRRTLLSAPRTVKTPSMHLIGEVDTLIAPERMYALADAFSDPFIFRHAGGHFVPSSEAARKGLKAFLDKVIPEHALPFHSSKR